MGIAFLILLIAWFNYINLSTANAMKRASEVGVRKVIGATQSNLVYQFLCESIFVNLCAVILAGIIIVLIQPLFNDLMGKSMSVKHLAATPMWMMSLGVMIVGSLAVGTYTAFLLSKFNPVKTLKGKMAKSSGGVFLRK